MATGQRSYLDHNATAPIRPEVVDAIACALALPGNPSSVHAEGRAARAAVEAAREQVAALVGAPPNRVIFTSGGTEANATVLSPSVQRSGRAVAGWRLLASAVEHPCVLDGHRFPADAVERIPVTPEGLIDLAWLEGRLAGDDAPAWVSIQAANQETGVLQPVADAARLVHARGGLMHTDAVQAAGKVTCDISLLGVDALSLSAHKIGGPKGCGAVVLASEDLALERLLRGGGQERGYRAGTENVAAIVGFGVAADSARRALTSEMQRLRRLRDQIQATVQRLAPEAVIFGASAERLPNTLAFAIPGLRAETALIAFDLEGIAVSSGSACASGKVRRSHVLEAMGIETRLAEGAIRVSLGWSTTESDVARFTAACEKVISALYKRRADAA